MIEYEPFTCPAMEPHWNQRFQTRKAPDKGMLIRIVWILELRRREQRLQYVESSRCSGCDKYRCCKTVRRDVCFRSKKTRQPIELAGKMPTSFYLPSFPAMHDKAQETCNRGLRPGSLLASCEALACHAGRQSSSGTALLRHYYVCASRFAHR